MTYVGPTEKDRLTLEAAVEASTKLYVKGIQEVGAAVRTSDGALFSGIHF